MRLTERVYLVGSGDFGFSLTDAYDCHVYLIDGGTELALVDCGAGLGLAEILANVQAEGFDLARLRHVLVTHAHADHAGGLARLQRMLDVEAVACAEAAGIIAAADEERSGLRLARSASFYPPEYRLEPGRVTQTPGHGDRFAIGDLTVTALATPGHASHSLSYLVDGALFAGDVIFHGGKVSLLNLPDCSIADLNRSIRMLAGQEFAALFPGHLSVSVRQGKRHLTAALERLDHLAVPESIL